jgi:hypothetical protein
MSEAIKTIGTSRIRHLRGGGIIVQQRRDDRELFAEIMIELRSLATRASGESAEYMRRNLIQQADRMLCGENQSVLEYAVE